MTEHPPAHASPKTDQPSCQDPPGMGRTILVSSSVGVVLALVLVTLGMVAAGQVWQSSFGLGLFVAFWGGLGFGSMVGGVLYLTRLEAAEHRSPSPAATPRTTPAAPGSPGVAAGSRGLAGQPG